MLPVKEHKLPDDLKYVAIAESALRPHAGSKKGAVGFWQFMAATGRKYGLEVNERIDERRNVFFSTQAAAQYFIELHRMFSSWTMVVPPYGVMIMVQGWSIGTGMQGNLPIPK